MCGFHRWEKLFSIKTDVSLSLYPLDTGDTGNWLKSDEFWPLLTVILKKYIDYFVHVLHKKHLWLLKSVNKPKINVNIICKSTP